MWKNNSHNINIDKNSISNITKNKIFQDKIMNKIRKISKNIMNQEKNICEIKHLSALILGRYGVGKSTLINAIYKKILLK